MIRALIVDDEPPARRRLRRLLGRESDVVVVGECGDHDSAVAAITRDAPDVAFVDIQLPGGDGFEVLRDAVVDGSPVVVFVTAFDDYAVAAFEVQALDYLLKPFDPDRFRATMGRVRARLGDDRLAIRDGDRTHVVRTDDIDYCIAAGNYVRIHAGAAEYLMRVTLTELARRLDPSRFVRIHRSTIVRAERVVLLRPMQNDFVVTLRDGTELTMSRTYRSQLRRLVPS